MEFNNKLEIIKWMRKNAILPKKLGKRVQRRRKQLGYTQEDLAEMVKVSRAYIGYIEQGRNVPSVELLERLARVLKIPLRELF